jgi:hypothetical protein
MLRPKPARMKAHQMATNRKNGRVQSADALLRGLQAWPAEARSWLMKVLDSQPIHDLPRHWAVT